jgi:hypothetical protein
MFDEDSIFNLNPHRAVQQVGDWWEQRKAFRLAALLALREREGLPGPVDEAGTPLETRIDDEGKAHYYLADGTEVKRVLFAGSGKDGKPGGFAIGKRKGADLAEADAHFNSADTGFEILEVSEDGRKLEDELRDLSRDSANLQQAERVSYGRESEQAPEFQLDGLSDEEVDARLQEYLKRGKDGSRG